MSDILTSKILVAEDYTTMVRIVMKFLEQMGFQSIYTASDGEEALELTKRHNFDLIISDWNMEPMTGLELLKRIRQNEKTKHIPFIMCTAEAKPDNVQAAQKAGVSNYISKPFNSKVLEQKIESVLGPLN